MPQFLTSLSSHLEGSGAFALAGDHKVATFAGAVVATVLVTVLVSKSTTARYFDRHQTIKGAYELLAPLVWVIAVTYLFAILGFIGALVGLFLRAGYETIKEEVNNQQRLLEQLQQKLTVGVREFYLAEYADLRKESIRAAVVQALKKDWQIETVSDAVTGTLVSIRFRAVANLNGRTKV
jgi:hypothetical protein